MFSLKAKDRVLEAKQLLNHKIINLILLTSLMSFQATKKAEILQKFKTTSHCRDLTFYTSWVKLAVSNQNMNN